ncbi:hypothetical protein [Pseudoalteromonas umbrosa]|nr:hypothetical protein [Pseudoalteromonas sp. B95]MDK1288379.1 hypothetical protein [Pseudoalteromonas sp. B95]
MNKSQIINSLVNKNLERNKGARFCGCVICLIDRKPNVGQNNK